MLLPITLLLTSLIKQTALDFKMLCLHLEYITAKQELKVRKCQRTQILSLCKLSVIFLNRKGISQRMLQILGTVPMTISKLFHIYSVYNIFLFPEETRCKVNNNTEIQGRFEFLKHISVLSTFY